MLFAQLYKNDPFGYKSGITRSIVLYSNLCVIGFLITIISIVAKTDSDVITIVSMLLMVLPLLIFMLVVLYISLLYYRQARHRRKIELCIERHGIIEFAEIIRHMDTVSILESYRYLKHRKHEFDNNESYRDIIYEIYKYLIQENLISDIERDSELFDCYSFDTLSRKAVYLEKEFIYIDPWVFEKNCIFQRDKITAYKIKNEKNKRMLEIVLPKNKKILIPADGKTMQFFQCS